MSVDIRTYKATALRTRSVAPTLFDVISAERDSLSREDFIARIPTWLSILDHDLKKITGESFPLHPQPSSSLLSFPQERFKHP